MIKLKYLITESEESLYITSQTIFNFYYLWYVSLHYPETVQTQYGNEILKYYTKQFKNLYVKMFSNLIKEQLIKYIERKRIDPDFPTDIVSKPLSPSELLNLMKKTWRSDMKRRNETWIMVAEFNNNLNNAVYSKDIFLWCDRCNNAIHNTQTSILGKFEGGYDLVKAFDIVHNAKSLSDYEKRVSKDIRQLLSQNSY